MKKTYTKKFIMIAMAALMLACLSACGSEKATDPQSTPTPAEENEVSSDTKKNDTDQGSTDQTEDPSEPQTVASLCLSIYKEKIAAGSTPAEALEAVAGSVDVMGTVETELPYLQGFDSDITGYTSYVTLVPGFGGLPFIMYSFETEDAEALTAELMDKANLCWNICAEADEKAAEVVDGRVVFVMAPFSFE